MRWTLKQRDILDEPADVLVCSANPQLNLSGGVGGAFLVRYGDAMQRELHGYLSARGLRAVERGEVVQMPPCGSPYRAVLHAVGVDAFYDSSPDLVTSVVTRALQTAAALSASKVALTAIATGYGRLSLADFAAGIAPVMESGVPPIQEVAVCLRKREDVQELSELLPQATVG
jgi:O-acetyl-ADP-ribose deacetylase (regulator of RNase III)